MVKFVERLNTRVLVAEETLEKHNIHFGREELDV